MRGQAQSGSRKLNKHWQSGGRKTPPQPIIFTMPLSWENTNGQGHTITRLFRGTANIRYYVQISARVHIDIPQPTQSETRYFVFNNGDSFNAPTTTPMFSYIPSVSGTLQYTLDNTNYSNLISPFVYNATTNKIAYNGAYTDYTYSFLTLDIEYNYYVTPDTTGYYNITIDFDSLAGVFTIKEYP